MADFSAPAPVAQNVNVGPAQGLQTLSGILGLKQQQQQLTYETATAQQAQQQQGELARLQQFAASAMNDPSYQNADGSLNVQKFQKNAMAVAPVFGAQYIGQITTNANSAVDNRSALLNLSNKQRLTISNYLSAVAQKPGATSEDLLDAVEQARSVSDDPGYQRAIDRMMLHAPQTVSLSTAQASSAIRRYAAGAAQYAANGGAAPLSQQQLDKLRLRAQSAGNQANVPQYASYMGRDNQTHFAQVNPNAPGGMRQDLGTAVPAGMSLSDRYSIQPGPGGQLMLTDRQTGRVVPLGGGGKAGSAPAGRLTADTDPQKPGPNDPTWRQQSYSDLVQRAQRDVLAAQDEDAGYQTNMATADMIRRLSNDVNSGPGTTAWTRGLGTIGTRFGAQNVADTQTLASFLDLQSSRLRDSMGLPNTNAGLATAHEMGTSIESQRAAIQAKTDYYQALTELQHRYRTGLDAAGNGGVNASPTAVSRFKSAFTANADPMAMEIELALQRGDKAAAQRMLSDLTPQQRKLIAQHGRNLDRLIGQGAQ